MSDIEIVYNNDRRYPGPEVYPLPDMISGTPTQAELDAQPRLFTWGELKEIIKSGELEYLSRNKEIQARYGEWITQQKEIWGSTENYLVNARLPWNAASRRPVEPTYDQRTALNHPEVNLTSSTNPDTKKDKDKEKKAKPVPVSPELRPIPGAGLAAVAAHQLGTQGSPAPSTPGSQMPYSHVATAASTPAGSGASTPSSVAYVSLDSVLPRVNKALARKKREQETQSRRRHAVHADTPSSSEGDKFDNLGGSGDADAGGDDYEEPDDPAHDVFLRWEGHLDPEKYAVLPNDWPYCVPYGVRHYCVWSRVPIAHPVLVNYDRAAWAKIEERGLGGFTGVVPVIRDDMSDDGREFNLDGGDWEDDDDDYHGHNDPGNTLPPDHPFTPLSSAPVSPVQMRMPIPTSPTAQFFSQLSPTSPRMPMTPPPKIPPRDGRRGPAKPGRGGWYAVDVEYGGREMRRWAGITYESLGGKEVGRMVRGLWDERGWETVWFVNPAHLQSIPGFSHFHVFARRKTPTEIDISEKVHAAREKRAMARAERSKRHQAGTGKKQPQGQETVAVPGGVEKHGQDQVAAKELEPEQPQAQAQQPNGTAEHGALDSSTSTVVTA